jgi:hypothetical protein
VLGVLIIDVFLRFLAINHYSCNPCWIFRIPLPFDGVIKMFVSKGSLPWDIYDYKSVPLIGLLQMVPLFGFAFFVLRNRWITASIGLFLILFNDLIEAYLNGAQVTSFAFKVDLNTTTFVFDTTHIFALAFFGLYCGVLTRTLWLAAYKRPSNLWIIRKMDERDAKKKLNAGTVPAGTTVDKP